MRNVRAGIRSVVATLVAAAAVRALAAAQQPAPPPATEMVQIDGGKNPELIPQWSAWGYAFRVFAGGPRQLPTSVLQHVSKSEASFVLAQADLVQRIDADCQTRLQKIVSRRSTTATLEALEREVRALSLECRIQTLEARDRVLAAINPDAQGALASFVESTKAGTSVTVPKSQLARFREPE
jgi:hypothetical protein